MSIRKSLPEAVDAFVKVVNAQDWRALETLVAPGFIRHAADSGPPVPTGRSALLDFLRKEFRAFPDAVDGSMVNRQ